MFGMGWSEMVVIGIVALIVVGPEELPGLFRTVGQYVGKAKGMAREFSRAMDQAADQSGMKDINKTLQAAANPKKFGLDQAKKAVGSTLDPERAEAKQKMGDAMAKAATERKEREAAEAAAEAELDRAEADMDALKATKVPAGNPTLTAAPKPAPKPAATDGVTEQPIPTEPEAKE